MIKHLKPPIIFLVILLCACENSSSIQRHDVIGVYKANHGKAIDTIALNKDGTYTHTYKNSNEDFREMNIWEFEYFQGQPLISFMNFSHKWDGKYFEGSKERWIWPAHVEKTIFGKIRLPLDDDLGFYFEKLEEERNVISE